MTDTGLKNWECLHKIQAAIERYRAGEHTDYHTIMVIRELLQFYGYI